MDFVSGSLVYAVSTWLFGRAFSLADFLVVSVLYAYLPDADGIPYIALDTISRTRFRRFIPAAWRDPATHWYIHFPLCYIPAGTLLVWMWKGQWFHVAAFVLASLAHFLHDSASVPGIRWFYIPGIERIFPRLVWMKAAYALHGFRFVRVSEAERDQFYDRWREATRDVGVAQKILMRIGKFRPTWFSR